jgi:hypothetical protein
MENISCSDKHIQSKLTLSMIRVSVRWLVACGQLCTEPTTRDRYLVFAVRILVLLVQNTTWALLRGRSGYTLSFL